jgi:hypothetical protein
LVTLLAAALQRQAHRVGMGHVTPEGFGDPRLQLGDAVAIEQAQQGGGDGAEVVAALGGPGEQLGAVGCGPGKAVGSAMLASLAFARRQLRDVSRILHLLALVVAARMRGDDIGAVQDPDLGRTGHHRECALHVGGRNAVVVAVETHIGCLAGADRLALVGGKGILRQG